MEQNQYDKSTKLRPPFEQLKGKKGLVIIEIGVYNGVNAKNMLEQLDIDTIYLVDPYKSYPNSSGNGEVEQKYLDAAMENAYKILAPFEQKIVWCHLPSSRAHHMIGDGIDALYVDGNHAYEYVKSDLEIYIPKVKVGGLIAGDDYRPREKGVRKAVDEYFAKIGIEHFCLEGEVWWTWKI